jgi:hypothetical protein
MFETRTQALSRPAHVLDLPALTVWILALAGSASLRLAFALDAANARRIARRESAQRPRARLGPTQSAQTDHLVPDSWRIR